MLVLLLLPVPEVEDFEPGEASVAARVLALRRDVLPEDAEAAAAAAAFAAAAEAAARFAAASEARAAAAGLVLAPEGTAAGKPKAAFMSSRFCALVALPLEDAGLR